MVESDSHNEPVLAIHGGRPVRSAPMPPRFAIGPDEEAMIHEVLAYYRERGLDPGYQGPFEERYCEAFTEFMGGGYADSVATGTASLYVAIAALELPAGGEVLVSPITDPGTLSAIVLNNLVPKLVDSEKGSFNTGPEQVEKRISWGTSCIVLVHSLGRAADVEGIVELARKRDIRVLEDCSQSHGARRDGKLVGTFGDIAAFSTMYRKASTTGASGGIVYTADEQLYHMTLAHADRGKPRWQDGFDDRNPSQFLFPALNLHTDEISCAIGLTSLARLPKVIDARLSFVREVYRLIEKRSRHCRPFEYSHEDSPFVYPVIVDTSRLECDKVAFAEALRSEGIGLNSHYQYLAADWPFMQRYYADDFDCPNARAIRDSSFCLYLNEHYGVTEAEDICAAIEKVETYYGH